MWWVKEDQKIMEEKMEVGQIFNPFKIFNGSFIPNCIMRLPKEVMSSTEKLVWSRLSQFAGKNGYCYPSQRVLADEVGLSEPVIQVALRNLEAGGFIKRINPNNDQKCRHMNNSYVFLWNEVFQKEVGMNNRDIESNGSRDIESNGSIGTLNPMGLIKDNHIKDNHKDYYSQNTESKPIIQNNPSNNNQNDSITPEQIQVIWNRLVSNTTIKPITKITNSRRAKMLLRIKEMTTLKEWRELIKKMCSTPFLCGHNDRGWVVNFDFVFGNDSKYVNILEGKYDSCSNKTKIDTRPTQSKHEVIDHTKYDNTMVTYINSDNGYSKRMTFKESEELNKRRAAGEFIDWESEGFSIGGTTK